MINNELQEFKITLDLADDELLQKLKEQIYKEYKSIDKRKSINKSILFINRCKFYLLMQKINNKG